MLHGNKSDYFRKVCDMYFDEFLRMDHFYDSPQPNDKPVIVSRVTVDEAETFLKRKEQIIEDIEFEEL